MITFVWSFIIGLRTIAVITSGLLAVGFTPNELLSKGKDRALSSVKGLGPQALQ